MDRNSVIVVPVEGICVPTYLEPSDCFPGCLLHSFLLIPIRLLVQSNSKAIFRNNLYLCRKIYFGYSNYLSHRLLRLPSCKSMVEPVYDIAISRQFSLKARCLSSWTCKSMIKMNLFKPICHIKTFA